MIPVLLDTQVFLWYYEGTRALPQKSFDLVNDLSQQCYFSQVSIWEMCIKVKLNKLKISEPIDELIGRLTKTNEIVIMNISNDHLYGTLNLENIHKDPFDRLLTAQAMVEKLPVVSADPVFDKYGIERIWE